MPQKVSYDSKRIDPVINGFSPNEKTIHFQICDHSMFTFLIRGLCLGFKNTAHVDSLDRLIKSVFDKVKVDICIYKRENNPK